MAKLSGNIPYGKIWSTISHHGLGIGLGAASGIATSYATGDGNMGRDALLGAAGGLAIGGGVGKSFMRGGRYGSEKGVFNAGQAMKFAGHRASRLVGF
jgi:hypothetical protein